MAHQHVRSAKVLDPSYLAGLAERSVADVRAMHAECLELETEVSYVRRLSQARIDILEAEIERRSTGGSVEDLINSLPQILADAGPRGNPATSRLPLQMAPQQESEWAPELEESEGLLANLTSLTEEQVRDAISSLRSLERGVSDERRELHGVIEHIDRDLAEKLK
jgi:hypothetical protein